MSLKKRLTSLIVEWNNSTTEDSYKILEKMKHSMESYLIDYPCDSEVLAQLALTVFTVPFADDNAAIDYLNKALECDGLNLDILLILAYIERLNLTDEDKVLDMLKNTKPKNDLEKAMVFYAQSWFYKHTDIMKYRDLLKKSVSCYDGYVWPNFYLGEYYKYLENYEEACLYFNKALKNVKSVFRNTDFYHIVDVKEFINERIKGNIVSDVNLRMLEDNIANCSNSAIVSSAGI